MAHFEHQPATPSDALAELLAGNERFVAGARVHPHQDAEHRAALADLQRPFAVMFGCSDSRLAAEIIFDRGLGDLFVVRTAGHIVGPQVLSSIEYGVTVLDVPLVVVLGHESCGAVRATLDVENGALPIGEDLRPIVEGVAPSVRYARAQHVTDDRQIIDVHVRRTVDLIISQGTALSAAVAAGRCEVVGLSYQLTDGRATVVTDHPAAV